MKNELGQTPKVGDQIVYSARRGDSVSLTVAQVLVVEDRRMKVKPLTRNAPRYLWGMKEGETVESKLTLKPLWIHAPNFIVTNTGSYRHGVDFEALEASFVKKKKEEYLQKHSE